MFDNERTRNRGPLLFVSAPRIIAEPENFCLKQVRFANCLFIFYINCPPELEISDIIIVVELYSLA